MANVLDSLKILIAEDAPDNLFLLTLVLEDEGATIVGVGDGNEALKKLRSGQFDVAILDISLPGIDGDKVALELRKDAVSVKKIALTGHINLDKAAEDAFDLVLQKPIMPDKLVEAVRGVVGS